MGKNRVSVNILQGLPLLQFILTSEQKPFKNVKISSMVSGALIRLTVNFFNFVFRLTIVVVVEDTHQPQIKSQPPEPKPPRARHRFL